MEKLWRSFSKEELQNLVNNSHNKKELAIKIGYSKKWSGYIKQMNEMINYYNFDISHFKNLRNQDLIGQSFGYLKVIKKDIKENNRDTKWICQCKCGNIISVRQGNLKSGNTTSCGCKSKETIRKLPMWEDLTDKEFGYWKVIGIDEEKSTNGTYWKCFCMLCKKTIRSITTMNLKQGKTLSCGCHTSSLKTLIIENFLKENNIKYEKEFSFPNLKGKGNKSLRFDFKVGEEDNFILIEYQGQQHYIPNKMWGGEEQLKRQQENDNKKRAYCKDNNIKLIEYNYELTEKELINKMEEDLSGFFRQ